MVVHWVQLHFFKLETSPWDQRPKLENQPSLCEWSLQLFTLPSCLLAITHDNTTYVQTDMLPRLACHWLFSCIKWMWHGFFKFGQLPKQLMKKKKQINHRDCRHWLFPCIKRAWHGFFEIGQLPRQLTEKKLISCRDCRPSLARPLIAFHKGKRSSQHHLPVNHRSRWNQVLATVTWVTEIFDLEGCGWGLVPEVGNCMYHLEIITVVITLWLTPKGLL